MRAVGLLLLLGGCDNLFALDHLRDPDPGSDVDAAVSKLIDASSDCPGGAFYGSYGAGGKGLLKLCLPAGPVTTLAFAGTVDTDNSLSCTSVATIDDVGTQICIKYATTIALASVRATGSRALVFVAADNMTVSGEVDVSSRQGEDRGAGGNWSNCQSSNGKSGMYGGSGGAGGSFATRGGDGGTNASGAFTGSRATALPDRVRGGCAGGNGGDGPTSVIAGAMGGKSGGAVYFIAGQELSFSDAAIVNASGMGGRGAMATSVTASTDSGGGGGGGGGSGGLIGLDAPLIRIAAGATFFANGGGGGAAASVRVPGGNGAEPVATAITTAAMGGTNTTFYAGHGGDGAVKATTGVNGAGMKSGGGGGGGMGYIVVFSPSGVPTTGKFSPSPQ
ncbi:MAG TPA: hypothetical protein VMZ53_23050 [Kofleriaceae bacterium]|nr:hypothetical protein [Kofleriaceae bacterium]